MSEMELKHMSVSGNHHSESKLPSIWKKICENCMFDTNPLFSQLLPDARPPLVLICAQVLGEPLYSITLAAHRPSLQWCTKRVVIVRIFGGFSACI
jgi:hypothetical protein